MGASVVPVVGQIIASVVVSKVASTVASKIGLSDDMAGLVGVAAGGFAASQIPGGIGSSAGSAGQAASGVDLSLSSGIPAPDLSIASQPAGSDLSLSSAPGAQDALSISQPQKSPGLLSLGSGSTTTPTARPVTSDRVIEASTTPGVQDTPETSWWEKLFSPEKTMDLVMGAASGYAKAGMKEYEINRPYEREDQLSREWEQAGTGNLGSIRRQFPTQGGQ